MRRLLPLRERMLSHLAQLAPEAKVLLTAVSGGPDSVALLRLLHGGPYRLEVAHFDHALRPVSAADAAFVQALCSELGLPCHSERAEVARIADGTVSNNAAKQVLDALWAEPSTTEPQARVDAVIEAKGLKQMNDLGALEAIIDEVLAANAKSVEEYRAGKEKAFNALVGQCMKATKGKGNPAQVNELLKKKLAG